MNVVYTPGSFLVTIPKELQVLGLARKVRFYEDLSYDRDAIFMHLMTKEKMIEHIALIMEWMRKSVWKSKLIFTIIVESSTAVLRIDKDEIHIAVSRGSSGDGEDGSNGEEGQEGGEKGGEEGEDEDEECSKGAGRDCKGVEPSEIASIIDGEQFQEPDTKYKLEIKYDGDVTRRMKIKTPVWSGKSQQTVDGIAEFDAVAQKIVDYAEELLKLRKEMELKDKAKLKQDAELGSQVEQMNIQPADTSSETPTKLARSVGFTEW